MTMHFFLLAKKVLAMRDYLYPSRLWDLYAIFIVVWSVYEQTCVAALDCGDNSLAEVCITNSLA